MEKLNITTHEDMIKFIETIALGVKAIGGKMVYVGGYVRDKIRKKPNKDIDVEIYGVTKLQLWTILQKYGVVEEIGSKFGILKLHGIDIDFAIPRREYVGHVDENKRTIFIPYEYSSEVLTDIKSIYPDCIIVIDEFYKYGHTDFIAVPDPFMSMEEASRRRDFTINSMTEDVLTGEIYDFYGGLKDLKNGIIKHVDPDTFEQDALRVLRGCQFASRFKFTIEPETVELCRSIDLSSLPKERIFGELEKALLKSEKPSIAFEAMREMEVLKKLFPAIGSLIGCVQPEEFHPEGDAYIHTLMVVDELAKIKDKSKNPMGLMLSGVCHDLGKAVTTVIENGKVSSKEHDIMGVAIAEKLLKGITTNKELTKYVLNMVENHMRPNSIAFVSSDKAVRKLIVETDIQEILLLSEADHKGRGICEKDKDYTKIKEWFDNKIEKLSTSENKIEPYVTGKDLIAKGVKPGKEMGELLRRAFEFQLEGKSKEEILDMLLVS